MVRDVRPKKLLTRTGRRIMEGFHPRGPMSVMIAGALTKANTATGVTLHLAALLDVDSVDSSGWRNRAARGIVQLPGRGDRVVANLGNWRGREPDADEWGLLTSCPCPACQQFTVEGLKASGIAGFVIASHITCGHSWRRRGRLRSIWLMVHMRLGMASTWKTRSTGR
jgi:hypothetical protein